MGATGWKLNIPLEEMKSSFLGILFLLHHGGYFWCILLHAFQHFCDTDWQPRRGSKGFRVVNRSQTGKLCFCDFEYGKEHGKLPYTLLETTLPGRLMICQADSAPIDVDQNTVLLFFILLKSALIGNLKYCWRWVLTICILGLKCTLWIILTLHTQTEVMCYCCHSEEFEQLD